MLAVNNTLQYYAAYGNETGYELYQSDGSNLNLVKDIDTGIIDSYYTVNFKGVIKNELFFSINDNKHGIELWKTNGLNNTSIFKDFNLFGSNGSGSGGYFDNYYSYSSRFSSLFNVNGSYYLSRENEIWKTNGTSIELWQSSSDLINYVGGVANKLIWLAFDKLYRSDGNTVELITTIPNVPYSPNSLKEFYELNGNLYFTIPTNNYGIELWKTDGTDAGTKIVKDITPGPSSSNFGNFCTVGNKLFFVAYTNTNGAELWVTDGTESGTFMLKDIEPGTNSSSPSNLTNLNDKLLIFSAWNSTNGSEIWKSDGTTAGTAMIVDIIPGPNSSNPSSDTQKFTVFKDNVYFKATGDVNYFTNFYATDGTTVSVVKTNLNVPNAVVFNDELYLGASVGYIDTELWKSDGTESGTTLVKDIVIGSTSSYPRKFFAYKNYLYFMANDGIHGEEFWILRKSCLDSLHLASSINTTSNYLANKAIVGETSNAISANA